MKLLVAALLLVPCTLIASSRETVEPEWPPLADLAWMAGHWVAETDAGTSEEVWLAPEGRLMLAMNRGVNKKSGKTSFEFLRIEERKDGLVYIASPSGRGATEFALVDIGERFVLFANPEHDFPKAIRYELDGSGVLHARVTPDAEGKVSGEEYAWKKRP